MKKKVLIILVIILGVYIASFFFVKSHVKKELENHHELDYKEISIGFLGGIEINDASYNAENFSFENADVDLDLDYLSFIKGERKTINGVKLSHTNIEIFDQKTNSIKPTDTTSVDLSIRKLQFKNVNLKVHRLKKVLEVEGLNFKMSDIDNFDSFNVEQLESLELNRLKYPINALQKIQIGAFSIKNKRGKINDLKIIPLLDKNNYSKALKHETDLIDLSIPSLDFMIDEFSLNDGDIETLIFDVVNFDFLNLEIHRDKTIADDKSIKQSYSKKLRDLNYNFAINHLTVKNSKILYGEKYSGVDDYAEIKFDEIEIELDSISNFNSNFARLKSQSILNKGSDLKLYITYDINADQSTFDAKIEAQNIDANTFSDMLKHSKKKEIEGDIQKISTEFQSKSNVASGDFSIEASDIKITLLNDQFKEKKIMTFIANNIIKDSINKSFEVEDIQKNPTKSLWNHLWSYIRFGLKRALLK